MLDDRYVAGLFDGEGYIRITKATKKERVTYTLFGGIGMTYYPLMELLQKEYGGGLYQNRHDLRNPNNRIQFMWIVWSRVAAAFLQRIHPYTVVKHDEIALAMELQHSLDTAPKFYVGKAKFLENRDEVFAYREDLYIRIKELKKRSFPPLLNDGPKRLGRKPGSRNAPMIAN